ncbi:neuronal acetylcholine receptor subunit alpha-7-like [Aplysia californica]|uniref:Neuronal acetylcholine receptor subunit alpha-7-like n=1 Tax=Aplysia californica TaxID=6500 RepID=A0ABM1A0I0_APLCA|nr:neuronal acetylcholine receptor subunit alpha-7-like [Aplysia californica]
MNVSLAFNLFTVLEMDDLKQKLAIEVIVHLKWEDKNLKWNPDDYGGLDVMYFNKDQIWTLGMDVNSEKPLFDFPSQNLVFPSGEVRFAISATLVAICNLDMTYFPFDTQTCRFNFAAARSSLKDILLIPEVGSVIDGYIEHGEWALVDIRSGVEYVGLTPTLKFPLAYFRLTLRRRPDYYVLTIIIPVSIVSFFAQLTFLVPVESGERLSYALTVLLSLSVHSSLVGSLMPRSASHTPIMMEYILIMFAISALCIVMTVVVNIVHWSRVVVLNDGRKAVRIVGISIPINLEKQKNNSKKRKCKAGVFKSGEVAPYSAWPGTSQVHGHPLPSGYNKGTGEPAPNHPGTFFALSKFNRSNKEIQTEGPGAGDSRIDSYNGTGGKNNPDPQMVDEFKFKEEITDPFDVKCPYLRMLAEKINLISFAILFLSFIAINVITIIRVKLGTRAD